MAEDVGGGTTPPVGQGPFTGTPEAVLRDAKAKADALKRMLAKSGNRGVVVMQGGSRHLRLEAWQMLAGLYNVTAKLVDTNLVDAGDVKGWEARAVAVYLPTGQEIGAGESMCTTDEKRWDKAPTFQVRSMAQTRAQAKALKSVFSWVAVLAGFAEAPAEEVEHAGIPGGEGETNGKKKEVVVLSERSAVMNPDKPVTPAQKNRLFAVAKDIGKHFKEEDVVAYLKARFGIEKFTDLKQEQYADAVERMKNPAPLAWPEAGAVDDDGSSPDPA